MRGVVRPIGSELGLFHEMAVTGRKVGADRAFYATLVHDKRLFAKALEMVMGAGPVYDAVVVAEMFSIGATKEYETRIPPERLEGFVTFWDPGWNAKRMAEVAGVNTERWVYSFARLECEPAYKQVRMQPLPQTVGLPYAEAVALLPEDEEPATAREVIAANMIHYLATGQTLLTGMGVFAADRPQPGDNVLATGQVHLSHFSADDRGLYLPAAYIKDGRAMDLVGVATRKKLKKS